MTIDKNLLHRLNDATQPVSAADRNLLLRYFSNLVTREDAEKFLVAYHEAVWNACADYTDYDMAGRDLAKEFLARFDATPSTPAPVALPDECIASGQSCSYAPEGPKGEIQCRYCGKQRDAAPVKCSHGNEVCSYPCLGKQRGHCK